jgi:hypothetical protein
VFVLTHYAREPLELEGGTTFTFVTDGIEAALERAQQAAGGKDVSLAGGASAAQQYLAAGLVGAAQGNAPEIRKALRWTVTGCWNRLLIRVEGLCQTIHDRAR